MPLHLLLRGPLLTRPPFDFSAPPAGGRLRSGTPDGPDERSGRAGRVGDSRPGSGDPDGADGRRAGKNRTDTEPG